MLSLDELTKVFPGPDGDVLAMAGVTLSVEAGELLAVQGPSGSGKSTLLFVAGALLKPTRGTVMLSGEDPYALSPNARSAFRAKNIGFIFQQFHLVPYLSVLGNVLAASTPCPQPGHEERVGQLLSRFHLEHRAKHLPSQLSVGERQRAALARALLNRPKLLLADEPTGNLDGENAAVVLDALRDYADNGSAVLLVTHDPAAAERAHRMVRITEGRLRNESAEEAP